MEVREMIDLLNKNELCSKYKKIFGKETSRKELFEASMTPEGIEYLCKHNVITPSMIKEEFREYINGDKCVLEDNRLGQFFVDVKGYRRIEADIDVLHLMDCQAVVSIPEWFTGEITISRGSKVILEFESNAVVFINVYDNSVCSLVGNHKSSGNRVCASCYDGDCVSKLGYDNKVTIR